MFRMNPTRSNAAVTMSKFRFRQEVSVGHGVDLT